MSQRQFSTYLPVADSTVARLELGALNPPHDVAFYNQLRAIDGVTKDDIVALEKTGSWPPWLAGEVAAATPRRNTRTVDVVLNGVRAQVYIEGDPELYSERQVRSLAGILGSEVEVCMDQVLSRWAERGNPEEAAKRRQKHLSEAERRIAGRASRSRKRS